MAKTQRFLEIRGVEGCMLLDHQTAGGTTFKHFVGYRREQVGVRPDPRDARQEIPRVEWTFDPGHPPHRVPEPYADSYFRRAIAHGDVDYVGTVDVDLATGKETKFVDRDLAQQSLAAKRAREHAAAVQAAADGKLEAAIKSHDQGKLDADEKAAHDARVEAAIAALPDAMLAGVPAPTATAPEKE